MRPSVWSDEARVMVRPYRAYGELAAALAAQPGGWRLALRRPLRWLLIIGAFVSLSSAGRLVWEHVLSGVIFWSFLPALQAAGVLIALLVVARERSKAVAIDLYFAGQAPWLLLLLATAGLALFAPRVYSAFLTLLGTGVLPGLVVLAVLWSTFLTWVFLRRGLDLGRARSAVGMLVLYGIYGGSMVVWFLLTNQVQPLICGNAS